jgi:hypothetical protein
LWLINENSYLQYCAIIGCYSWYEEGLELIYRIISVLNKYAGMVCYYPSVGVIQVDTEDMFYETTRKIFDNKHQAFYRIYGDIHIKIPPKDFYVHRKMQTGRGGRLLTWVRSLFSS